MCWLSLVGGRRQARCPLSVTLEGPLFLRAWLFTLGWPASLFAIAVVYSPRTLEPAWPPLQGTDRIRTESTCSLAAGPFGVVVSYFLLLPLGDEMLSQRVECSEAWRRGWPGRILKLPERVHVGMW